MSSKTEVLQNYLWSTCRFVLQGNELTPSTLFIYHSKSSRKYTILASQIFHALRMISEKCEGRHVTVEINR